MKGAQRQEWKLSNSSRTPPVFGSPVNCGATMVVLVPPHCCHLPGCFSQPLGLLPVSTRRRAVRRENGRELPQSLAANAMNFHSKYSTLVHQAGETGQQDVPWMDDGRHARRQNRQFSGRDKCKQAANKLS